MPARTSPARPIATTALLFGAAVLSNCSPAPEPAGDPVVRTAVPQPAATLAVASYTGVVRARFEAAVGFRVGGKIAARLVDAGQPVRRGQPLLALDANDLDLSRAAASDRVRAAEAEARRTAADEARLQPLVATGAVSASAYDGARAARDAAAATLAAARAAAANAANEAGYAVLRADNDGIVTEILAEPGQVVAAGTPVLRLAQAGPREALVSIPETRVADLPRTATALLFGEETPMRARLRELAGAADPLTRSFAARYVLDGAAPPLGATITLVLGADSAGQPNAAALAVPLAALVDPGQGAGLWLVDSGNRVHFRRVQPLRLEDERAVLPAGAVPLGSHVVAMGGHLLREGQKVRLATSVAVP